MKKVINSIRKNFKSYSFALNGIRIALINGNNFKIHVLAGFSTIALGFYSDLNSNSWVVIIILIGLVLMAELLNTAIEKLADFVHPKNHPEIGRIKDISAGAVLVISASAFVVAIIIFGKALLI